jgi:glycosyltransferase involved in cell wall biosynthesis
MAKVKRKIYFVANVEFAVNAFLLSHLKKLSRHFDLTVIVNTYDLAFLIKQGLNIKVIDLKISRDINLPSDFFCLIYLLYLFIKDRPDAVHSITPKSGLLAMIASFFSAVPLRIHTFTGQVWLNKKGVSRFFLRMLDRLIGSLASLNIVDSSSQREFLVEQNVLIEKKSVVFGSGSVSGVDLKKFKSSKKLRDEIRVQLSVPNDALVYIYLGRLTKDKGVLDLASAFSNIQDNRAYLIMVGPDEANLTDQIESLVGDNRDKLRLIGFSSEPQHYLTASDVLCLPSYREGFGSVIIEAAALGLPSIASNIYGISDAIQNHKTGFLHPPGDIDAISECIKRFLLDSELIKSYGKAAKKRAVSEFDANLLSKYWLDFYLHHLH